MMLNIKNVVRNVMYNITFNTFHSKQGIARGFTSIWKHYTKIHNHFLIGVQTLMLYGQTDTSLIFVLKDYTEFSLTEYDRSRLGRSWETVMAYLTV
jgi:hypothetical protein